MERYRLFELNEYIRRVLALNLADPVWISCELAQVRESRGHYYLEVVEKDEDDDRIIAQASAVIWQRRYRSLRRRLGRELHALLQEGMAVLLQVRVDFHERYGFKLMIEDIDPAYSLGQLEMRRRAIMERLQAEQLIGKNREQPLPVAIQRIAVISSELAAGYRDFMDQLTQNAYGLTFSCTLFPSAMQGEQVEAEMQQQLKKIRRRQAHFDAVVIIRGGGARLDLAAFDSYVLAKAIAEFPLPVLSGIGHEIDETVLDHVVHRPLKTPTAVAEFILHRNLEFDSTLWQAGQFLRQHTREALQQRAQQLHDAERTVRHLVERSLQHEQEVLASAKKEIPLLVRFALRTAHRDLDEAARINSLLGLENTLQRGFTVTTRNGSPLTDAREVQPDDVLITRFANGQVSSLVRPASSPNPEQHEQ